MKIDLNQATFIIPIRIESIDRLRNVITIVAFLLENFNTKRVIKEVDSESIFKKKAMPILNEILETEININHIFEKSLDHSFHRQKILNEMIMHSNTKIIVNYDCDVILPLKSYKTAYELILTGQCDVVYPYGHGVYQRQVIPSDEVVSDFLKSLNYDFLEKNSRLYESDFGWVQFFDRQVYINGGMENENFISYAPEDKERFYRFTTLGYNICRISEPIYHLEHFRGQNSWINNPHMEKNNDIWNQIQKMDKHDLINYYSTQEYLKKYNGQK